jgi:serine/threonine protein kinase
MSTDSKYQIHQTIGSGAYGTVYYATVNRRPVALKIGTDCRLKYEANILEYMQSFNPKKASSSSSSTKTKAPVPKLHWFGNYDPQTRALAMSYFPGPSARECMDAYQQKTNCTYSGTCVNTDPMFFLESVIGILHFLFERRIVHRDIKPAHFIYSGNGWRLVDFGLAVYVPEPETTETTATDPFLAEHDPSPTGFNSRGTTVPHRAESFSERFIHPGKIVGNLRYASVRRHQGCSITMCDDAISVGYLVYEWIHGLLPWQDTVDYTHVQQLKEQTDFYPIREYFEVCTIPGYISGTTFGFF